jgi:hypothetical protein
MKKILYVSISLFFLLTTITNAALNDNGDGTVTQTRNDGSKLMWIRDGNLAETETFGVSGILSSGAMNWDIANDWIDAMNSANYLGYNDWRLPITLPLNGTYDYQQTTDGSTDFAWNISAPGSAYPGSTSSELAYMYYTELGNAGYYYPDGSLTGCSFGGCPLNMSIFTNLQAGEFYWSGTDYIGPNDSPDAAWTFSFYHGGYQDDGYKSLNGMVWAVRVVPEPISSLLFVAGGTLLAGRRYLKRKNGV